MQLLLGSFAATKIWLWRRHCSHLHFSTIARPANLIMNTITFRGKQSIPPNRTPFKSIAFCTVFFVSGQLLLTERYLQEKHSRIQFMSLIELSGNGSCFSFLGRVFLCTCCYQQLTSAAFVIWQQFFLKNVYDCNYFIMLLVSFLRITVIPIF